MTLHKSFVAEVRSWKKQIGNPGETKQARFKYGKINDRRG